MADDYELPAVASESEQALAAILIGLVLLPTAAFAQGTIRLDDLTVSAVRLPSNCALSPTPSVKLEGNRYRSGLWAGFGTRPIFAHVNLLMQALEAQTGIHIACCQSGVAGIPWGSTVVSFEAHDEPARQLLLGLVRSEPGRYQWLMRCQPGDRECFMNITPVPKRREGEPH